MTDHLLNPAVACGLLSALSYGIADYLSRTAGRAVGVWRTSFYYYLIGLVVVSVWILLDPRTLGLARVAPLGSWLAGIASGIALSAAVVLFTQALIRGEIGVVVPVTATYGAVTTLLSFFVVGERFSGRSLAGLALIIIGASVVSIPAHRGQLGRGQSGTGWALAAAVAYGAGFWLQGTYSVPELGAILPMWLVYATGLTLMTLLYLTGSIRLGPPRHLVLLIPTLVASLFGIGGFAALAIGLNTQNLALVVVLSSLTSAVTVGIAAVCDDSTRLRWPQWTALLLVIVGLALTRL
jgi:drug/metabolite transporter (DMT)-like permease